MNSDDKARFLKALEEKSRGRSHTRENSDTTKARDLGRNTFSKRKTNFKRKTGGA